MGVQVHNGTFIGVGDIVGIIVRSQGPASGGVAAPSGLSYGTNPASYAEDSAISTNSATVTGTGITFSVSPALPTGLSLNASTGAITGTPTTPTASAVYVVTATNSGGSTTCDVTIAITDVFAWDNDTNATPGASNSLTADAAAAKAWSDSTDAGAVEFSVVIGAVADTEVGLTTLATFGIHIPTGYNDADYSFYRGGAALYQIQNGSLVGGAIAGGVTTGDTLTIRRNADDSVDYLVNGVVKRSAAVGHAAGKTLRAGAGCFTNLGVLISSATWTP